MKKILSGLLLATAVLTLSACSEKEVDISTAQLDLTIQDAVKEFQSSHPDAQLTSISLEYDNKKYVMSVDGFDDENEYELNLNAETKEVITDRSELLSSEDKYEAKTDGISIDGIVEPEKAIEAALAESTGIVTGYDIDSDYGVVVYDVQLLDGKNESEVRITAKDGKVVGIENED